MINETMNASKYEQEAVEKLIERETTSYFKEIKSFSPEYLEYLCELVKILCFNSRRLSDTYGKLINCVSFSDTTAPFGFYTGEKDFVYFPNVIGDAFILSDSYWGNRYWGSVLGANFADDQKYILRDALSALKIYDLDHLKNWSIIFEEQKEKGKWKNIKKELNVYQTTTIRRFFNKHTKHCTQTLIQDIETTLLPPKMEITTDPHKIAWVYEHGPQSCMKTSSSDSSKWRDTVYEEDKLVFHPTMFYGMYPGYAVAYAYKGDKVLARAVLSTEKKTVTRRYFAESSVKPNFNSFLKDNGYVEHQDNDKNTTKKIKVSIPGIFSKVRQDYLLPTPYVDGRGEFTHTVVFDTKTKHFILSPKHRTAKARDHDIVNNFRNTGGYIAAKTCIKMPSCIVCSSRVPDINKQYQGQFLCSNSCAHAVGLVLKINAIGRAVLQPRTGDDLKCSAQDIYFTTEHAGYKYLEKQARDYAPISQLDSLLSAARPLPSVSAFPELLKQDYSETSYSWIVDTFCGYTKVIHYKGYVLIVPSKVLSFIYNSHKKIYNKNPTPLKEHKDEYTNSLIAAGIEVHEVFDMDLNKIPKETIEGIDW